MKNYLMIYILIAGLLLLGFAHQAHAQLLPLGGWKTVLIPCTASPPYFLEYYIPAGPGEPPTLMEPPTIPYSYYAFMVPGAPMVGMAAPVTIPCLVYAGVTVITIGVGNPVIPEGTGLVGMLNSLWKLTHVFFSRLS